MNDTVKNVIQWVILLVVLMLIFSNFSSRDSSTTELSYDQFISKIEDASISSANIHEGGEVTGMMSNHKEYSTRILRFVPESLTKKLLEHNVSVHSKAEEQPGLLMSIIISWFPMLLFIGIWVFFMRQMQGGGKGAMSFGKSRARMLGENQVKVTFADVAGVDEAKEEVGELVDFLRDPDKFLQLGGMIPKGVLMVGSPGTGKTLLAKAIAGEAKVPFFTISGSDFVEMFVGVGASRVRDMFEQAKRNAPCIIFIDEIDAVGRHRGSGMGGGHDEREQTLNQMLVEMDGFEGSEGVIVIAATNRPDVLDKALLRPGRFDRRIVVPLPDLKGREQILNVHIRKVKYDKDVKTMIIARGTPGFSGADLANLVNEAALLAARSNKDVVSMSDFDQAKDKIMMGTERRNMVMQDHERKNTAYHEAGHAIVGLLSKEHDPVYKVSIIPRGMALGITMYLPEEDKYSHSKQSLESRIASLYGGRIAEELILGESGVTTGASNDIEKATEIARSMVINWGLSALGPLNFEEEHSVAGGKVLTVSGETHKLIDKEIRDIIDRNYARAKTILQDNMEKLHLMAEALLKYETIDAGQINDIMQHGLVRPPKDWVEEKSAAEEVDMSGGDAKKDVSNVFKAKNDNSEQ